MDEQLRAIKADYLPKLKNPLMIVAFRGWNDGGQASTNAVRRMIAAFDAKRFATIDPEEFYVFSENRPKVKLVDGQTRREIEWQKNVFYHAELPGTGRDVVLFLGTEPNLKWRTFGAEFTALGKELGVNYLVTMGAYLGAGCAGTCRSGTCSRPAPRGSGVRSAAPHGSAARPPS